MEFWNDCKYKAVPDCYMLRVCRLYKCYETCIPYVVAFINNREILPSGIFYSADSDSSALPACDAFRDAGGSENSLIVTEDGLKEVNNDIQFVLNCSLPMGSILFSTPIVKPRAPLIVEKPIGFGVVNTTKVAWECPPEGTIFDIRWAKNIWAVCFGVKFYRCRDMLEW